MSENTTWGNIGAGDVVEGTNGSLWSVLTRAEDGNVTVVNALTSKEVTQTPAADKPVVRVIKAEHMPATARNLAKTILNAQEIGTRVYKNGLDEWICPVGYGHPGSMTAHLLLYHGMYGSAVAGRSLEDLEALHGGAHTPAGHTDAYLVHVHSPEYPA